MRRRDFFKERCHGSKLEQGSRERERHRGGWMRSSNNKILTTHAGSLSRPPNLIALSRARAVGENEDKAAYATCLTGAVADVVRKQRALGIDIPDDSEFGKPVAGMYDYGAWWNYAFARMSGFSPVSSGAQSKHHKSSVVDLGLTSFARGEDYYYKTEEEFLFASADAMREEYKAIVEAGIVLQIDDPSLPDNWDMINPEPPLAEFKKFEEVRIEALNHALRGLPQDRIRYHICWGSWHGPHTTDIPLADIVDLVLSVNAGAYSVEAGNVRHEHEWRVWQDAKLPAGKVLIPGVVSHATNIVEHPQVVADRIVRYARVVGRENVIAGTD